VLYSCRRCWPAAAAARPLHCTSAQHRTHHPPRLALLPRQAVLLVQTRQTAPARTHAFHGRRTGPARANRWSEAAHPPVLFLSECHSCASLSTPYKETTPNPPYPISPPPLLSFLPSPHKNICTPSRLLLPLPPPPFRLPSLSSSSPPSRVLHPPPPPPPPKPGPNPTPPRRRPIRGRCRPQPWRCRPRPRLTQVRTRARSGQLRRPAFFSPRSCSPSPPRGASC
jgi:hypothetical protein